jgi:hypothetical protein
MTSRARLYDLYSRREAARVAGLGRALSQAVAERAEAEAKGARLQQLVRDIQAGSGPSLAATLRASGLLATSLAEEAHRQDLCAENAGMEATRLRQTMGLHDRRRLFGEQAADLARKAEAEEREAREQANRPPPRRRV